MLSHTEENYIKAIYHLSLKGKDVTTNSISDSLKTKPSSVTDMVKRLSDKKIINYIKYQGVTLTQKGNHIALGIVRKHRLWEVFLVEKLKFNWDEVHEIAEQLEHIESGVLIKRLDEFLGHPSYDPHGDPIPNERGEINHKEKVSLNDLEINSQGIVIGLKETSPLFLQYLDKTGIYIGVKIKIIEKIPFDESLEILLDSKKTLIISKEVSKNILLTQ